MDPPTLMRLTPTAARSAAVEGLVLGGTVEIDGAYVGGHLRPANARTDRVDRRLRVHRGEDRRSVIAIRQRDGRTLTDVFKNEAEAVHFARSKVAGGSKLVADETPHWDQLAGDFDLERVNHSDAYSFLDGIHVNGAERFLPLPSKVTEGEDDGLYDSAHPAHQNKAREEHVNAREQIKKHTRKNTGLQPCPLVPVGGLLGRFAPRLVDLHRQLRKRFQRLLHRKREVFGEAKLLLEPLAERLDCSFFHGDCILLYKQNSAHYWEFPKITEKYFLRLLRLSKN
jgi:hypothetical protein